MIVSSPHCDNTQPLDVIIVGAGFAGLYALHLLREQGLRVLVLERGEDVGGTWYWNRYPGARCDVQSLAYCYMFDAALNRTWEWSERYAAQPEIQRYLGFVADRLDLRRDIHFATRVETAHFDETSLLWSVGTATRETYKARWVIMATGALSAGRIPDLCGLHSFEGAAYHTGAWPAEGVDFSGKRVAVIGTGSSGVQAIPLIAQQAAQLTVFQRTPGFVAPARNGPIAPDDVHGFSEQFDDFRDALKSGALNGGGDIMPGRTLPIARTKAADVPPYAQQEIMEACWNVGGVVIAKAFDDVMTDANTNALVADFFRKKIRGTVADPSVAELLIPRIYPLGAKRICVGTDYYETYNRPNVELVDCRESPIEAVTPEGIHTRERNFAIDVLVFATGFDAFTGALTAIDIRGDNGKSLRAHWTAGARTFLGLAVTGFPNLFTVTGPGSPSALSTMTVSIEQHVEWIAALLEFARSNDVVRIEAEPAAEEAWTDHVRELASDTVFMEGNSWYLGANVPGKSRVFLAYVAGVEAYRAECDEVTAQGYRGFMLTRANTRAVPITP